MNTKYLLGACVSLPLLPVLYLHAKRLRKRVPRLPEAQGKEGRIVTTSGTKCLTLLTIGESTIAGVGVNTHEEGFTGALAQEVSEMFQVNIRWKVYARSGYTAKKVCDKIIPSIEETRADVVVVGLGANDAFTLNTPARWRNHIHELIREIRKKFPSALIMFNNMPPIKDFPAFSGMMKFVIGNLVEILGKELEDLVRYHRDVYYCNEIIRVQDWIARFRPGVDLTDFFSDGVHPSAVTYQLWAREVARCMRALEFPEKLRKREYSPI